MFGVWKARVGGVQTSRERDRDACFPNDKGHMFLATSGKKKEGNKVKCWR